MPDKSDKEILMEMFTKRGIGFTVNSENIEGPSNLELVKGEHENVGGYTDFSTGFRFDENDNLFRVEIWE